MPQSNGKQLKRSGLPSNCFNYITFPTCPWGISESREKLQIRGIPFRMLTSMRYRRMRRGVQEAVKSA